MLLSWISVVALVYCWGVVLAAPAANSSISAGTAVFRNSSSALVTAAVTTTTSAGIGDFVASGLGLEQSSEETTTQRSSVDGADLNSTTSSKITQSLTVDGGGPNSTTTIFRTTTPPPQTFVITVNTSTPTASLASATISSSSASNSTFSNFTYTGDCWAEWNEYWSISVFDRDLFLNTEVDIVTTTTPVAELSMTTLLGDWTLTEVLTETFVSFQGALPVATSTYTTTDYETGSNEPYTVTLSYTTGFTSEVTTVTNIFTIPLATAKSGAVTTPACVLPSVVPQCQEQWDGWLTGNLSDVLPFTCSYSNSASCSSAHASWESGLDDYLYYVRPARKGYTPICTQASIAASACSTLVSSFLTPPDAYGAVNGPHVSISPWPSTSTLAPGCTLGCQSCAITGDSVRLFYWPSAATATNASGVAHPTVTAAPLVTAPVIKTDVLYLNGTNFTFTSPTVYISYNRLYASDSCSGIGATYSHTIIPLINTDDLSSLSYDPGDQDYAGGYKTLSFDLNDLATIPVPDSVYNKDPRCEASSHLFDLGGGGIGLSGSVLVTTSSFSCTRTGPYAPIIAVPKEVLQLDPEWKGCSAWYGGLFDPPKALRPTDSIVGVTEPNEPKSTSKPASPVSTASSDQAPSTSAGKVTAVPETTKAPTSAKETDPASQTGGTEGSTTKGAQDPSASDQGSGDESSTAKTAPGDTTAGSGDPSASDPSSDDAPSTTKAAPGGTTAGADDPSASDPGSGDESHTSAADPGGVVISILAAATATEKASGGESGSVDGASVGAGPTPVVSAPDSGDTGNPPGQSPSAVDPEGSAPDNAPTNKATAGGDGAPGSGINGESPGRTTAAADPQTSDDLAPGNTDTAVPTVGAGTEPQGSDPSSEAQPATRLVTVASQTLAVHQTTDASGNTATVVNGETLSGGQAATVSGLTVSAESGGAGGLVINGQTTSLGLDNSASTAGGEGDGQASGAGSEATGAVLNGPGGGGPVTVVQKGSSVILAGSSSTTTVPLGGQATVDGQTISIPPTGGAALVGGSTVSLPTAQGSDAPQAVFTGAGGQSVSAFQQGSSIVLAEGGSRTTVSFGGQATIGGQTISVPTPGGAAVVDGSTVGIPTGAAGPGNGPDGAVFTEAQGQAISAIQQGSAIVLADGSSTTTVPFGAQATFDGATISAPTAGGAAVVDGSTVSLPTGAASQGGEPSGAVFIGSDGQTISAVQQGSLVVLADGSSTATIAFGAQATFDGATISVPSSGGAAVVGSSTLALASGPTEAVFTGSDGQSVSAVQEGSSVVLADGSSTTTVAFGAKATFDGATVSIPSSGGVAVVGTLSLPLTTSSTGETVVTFDGHTFTASGSSGIEVIDGITLTSGQAAKTISGVVVSEGPSGLVFGAQGTSTTVVIVETSSMSSVGASNTGSHESGSETSSSSSSKATNDAMAGVPWRPAILLGFIASVAWCLA